MTDNKKSCEGNCPCMAECPLSKAVGMIGGKWKMRIMCALRVDGTLRYKELQQKIGGITPAMLSSSLKELEECGLLTREQFNEVPVRVEYSLTEHGEELFPILHRLVHWSRNEPFDGDEMG